MKSIRQGPTDLPLFEEHRVKIDGKCVTITHGLSQALLSQGDRSFKNNLETSADYLAGIYECIVQGKQVSK